MKEDRRNEHIDYKGILQKSLDEICLTRRTNRATLYIRKALTGFYKINLFIITLSLPTILQFLQAGTLSTLGKTDISIISTSNLKIREQYGCLQFRPCV